MKRLSNVVKILKLAVISVSLFSCDSSTKLDGIDTRQVSAQSTSKTSKTSNVRVRDNDQYINVQVQTNLSDLSYSDIPSAEFIEKYFEFSNQVSSTQFMISEPVSFIVPEDTVSFSLNFHNQLAGGDLFLAEIINPNGETLYMHRLTPCFHNSCNMVMPSRPNDLFQPIPGEWQYRVTAEKTAVALNLFNDTLVNMLIRVELGEEDTDKTGTILGTLPIQAWYTGDPNNKEYVTEVMNQLIEVFYLNGIGIDWKPPIYLADTAYAAMPPSFDNPVTASMMQRGESDVINVYFVESFDILSLLLGDDSHKPTHPGMASDLEFLLGIAAGIPGSLGTKGLSNGVMVGLTSFSESGELELRPSLATAETAAHEIGHFLGLFHTTERSGKSFDVLDDTPMCVAPPEDADEHGVLPDIEVTPENCPDGFNLMFPLARSDDKPGITLTNHQRFVLINSPLAR